MMCCIYIEGFGSATTTASGLGGFGAFGTNTATTTVPSLFGATNFSTGFGGFGSTAVSSAAPSFSANFNPPAATSAFNAFATNTATTSVAPNFSFNTFGTGMTLICPYDWYVSTDFSMFQVLER